MRTRSLLWALAAVVGAASAGCTVHVREGQPAHHTTVRHNHNTKRKATVRAGPARRRAAAPGTSLGDSVGDRASRSEANASSSAELRDSPNSSAGSGATGQGVSRRPRTAERDQGGGRARRARTGEADEADSGTGSARRPRTGEVADSEPGGGRARRPQAPERTKPDRGSGRTRRARQGDTDDSDDESGRSRRPRGDEPEPAEEPTPPPGRPRVRDVP